jgi:hypothetical protein
MVIFMVFFLVCEKIGGVKAIPGYLLPEICVQGVEVSCGLPFEREMPARSRQALNSVTGWIYSTTPFRI